MNSRRPYIIRGIYEWIVDNGMTPHIKVSVQYPDVIVPPAYQNDEYIVLNIAMGAITSFQSDNIALSFSARFKGSLFDIYVPVGAIQAIYANENGKGYIFEKESIDDKPDKAPRPKGKPTLRVVK